ncbi:multinuclear nonheme iron-dependent oxidase [Spirosoma validum]|uniref:DUF692 family protein n=1 Tax=Spirosoma validum TaxID=2771355 RepID=A0A927B607_9BACT|nr:DUF692 family multinuclear iron-containing protein [Spirosoma validum]MBD2755928.1 DUF692 family protein [Spirosoma validum]
MPKIYSSIACNVDTNILQATLPLFEAEKVQAIEWSFDTLYQHNQIPDWFAELLQAYGQENRLIGHGVFFSLFAGKWTTAQQEWLDRLKKLASEFTFNHITEHFGFMTGEDFHKGAPISVPFISSTLALGQDRLKRIQNACNCPVGLENLAFAYSLDEVKQHGDFLNQLIEPINGFIILDLHNLYCQSQNFSVAVSDLLSLYPLDRVREIHISGGSWTSSSTEPEKRIRRDTHDEAVPMEVFELLEQVIAQCPNLNFVVLEQLGSGLITEESRRLFQEDFLRMDDIITTYTNTIPPENLFLPLVPFDISSSPLQNHLLHTQQTELSTILETATNYQQAQHLLRSSSLANSAWQVENWNSTMLETALAIAQKWQHGFN